MTTSGGIISLERMMFLQYMGLCTFPKRILYTASFNHFCCDTTLLAHFCSKRLPLFLGRKAAASFKKVKFLQVVRHFIYQLRN